MANVELINQILNAYRASGVSEDRLAEMQSELQKMNDTELQLKLTEALNQRGNWGNIGDSFTFNTNLTLPEPAQKPISFIPTPSVESTIPQLTTEQAQNIAMENLWAMSAHLATAQGELDSDKIDERVQMLINLEARELYYLDKARSPQGLTFKEYLEGMKGDLRVMLLANFPGLDGENSNLDQRLDSMSPDEIRMTQKALVDAGLGKIDKNEVLRMLGESTQIVETYTTRIYEKEHTETRVKIKPPYEYSQSPEAVIEFEDLYKVLRGVEFNPDKIRQYLIDGTVTYYGDIFENGMPTMDDLEKHIGYVKHLPSSYISSFGQPYRAEYLDVLKKSDYDSSAAYGVNPVKLDSSLQPSEEGLEYVIPTGDLTQSTNARELDEKELKRFSVNMLYNILNTTYSMFEGYYNGAWEQLKSGSVGTAAVQGFLGFGEMLSGQDLTVRSQMDKVGELLAKAAQLKNMDDNAFEQHFEELFKEISGTSFDPAAMQNFAQLTMKGVRTDTDKYDEAVKRAFGSNRTGDAEGQFSILNPINSVTDVVAFLAGSEVLGGTKLFAALGTKSLQTTAKIVTKLGFNPASKGVQTGIRLISSSPVSAANLMTYTGLTEIGGTTLYNAAEKMDVIKPQYGEYMSVLDKADKSLLDDDMVRILVDMTKQGAMGSVAPFIGAFANKTGRTLATTFSKGNPTAIQKSFSALSKAESKSVSGQTLISDYLAALDTPALTKAQKVIETSSGFLTEVAGFTGYSTLEHIAEGLLTGELDIDSLDLGEEFKGQLQGLATLKGVARFIQMKKSGAVARGVQDKVMADMTEHLKNYEITDLGGKYRVINKKEGKLQTFDKPEDVINHLFEQMYFDSVVADFDREKLNVSEPENAETPSENYSNADITKELEALKKSDPEKYEMIKKYQDNSKLDSAKLHSLIEALKYSQPEDVAAQIEILDFALENDLEINRDLYGVMNHVVMADNADILKIKTDLVKELLTAKNVDYSGIRELLDSVDMNNLNLAKAQQKTIQNLLNNHGFTAGQINNFSLLLESSPYEASIIANNIDNALSYVKENGYSYFGAETGKINPLKGTYIIKASKDGKIYNLTFSIRGEFIKSEFFKNAADIKSEVLETSEGNVVNFTSKHVEQILDRFVKEVKDSKGKTIYKEYYIKSKDFPNKYDIYKKYEDGRQFKIGSAEKTESGNMVIEKTLESTSGDKTLYFYAESPNGDRYTHTKVLDSDGKVQFENSHKFKKINENHYKSTTNGITHDIKYESDKIIVTDEDGNISELPIVENGENGISKDLVDAIKLLPGSVLVDIQKYGLKRIMIGNSGNAHYEVKENELVISKEYASSDNLLFILLHELGHYKDNAIGIRKDAAIRDAYKRERKVFLENHSEAEFIEMQYFIENTDRKSILKDPMEEMIAEVNAILYSNNTSPKLETRSAFMQEHFPQTFKLIAEKMQSSPPPMPKTGSPAAKTRTILQAHESDKPASSVQPQSPKSSEQKYTQADIDKMKANGEPVTVKDGIVYKFDPVSKKNVEIGEISETVPVESSPSAQAITEGVRERLKSFGMEKVFTEDELLTDGKDISKQVGVDKDGKPVYELTEKGEELVWRASKQIREAALANEPNIIKFMRELGLASDKSIFKDEDGNMLDIAHRSKSEQSLHDKIRTAILNGVRKNKNTNLAQAIADVKDGIGCRTANVVSNYANEPDVKAALDKGDMKTAIMLAVEHESAVVYDALIKYIDSVAEGTNKVKLLRIANYIGEDGIPYFTERQLNRLMAYADSKNISIPFIERVYTLAERKATNKSDDIYDSAASTQIRGSGYTALQMNFVDVETGFIYEWQYRGEKVNEFAEGEHVPYDLRTGKDIIGKNTELKGLYEPMKKILSKEKMSPEEYTEYENYLTAFYEYLRLNELGFNDGTNPPKLPAKFDARLRAENLMLLHEYSEKVKKSPSDADKLTKEYESKLIKNTSENTTTESYTEKAKAKQNDRVIDRYEASRRVGEKNGLKSEGKYSSIVIKACRDNGTGQIRENLVKQAEQLQLLGVDDVKIARIITKSKGGQLDSVVGMIKDFKAKHPEYSENRIAEFVELAIDKDGFINGAKMDNIMKFQKETYASYEVLSHIYEKIDKAANERDAGLIKDAARRLCQSYNSNSLAEMKNSDSLNNILDECFDKSGKIDDSSVEVAAELLKCKIDLSMVKSTLQLAKNSDDGKIWVGKDFILDTIKQTDNFKNSGATTRGNLVALNEILKAARTYKYKFTRNSWISYPSIGHIDIINNCAGKIKPKPNETDFMRLYRAAQVVAGSKNGKGDISRGSVNIGINLLNMGYTANSAKEVLGLMSTGKMPDIGAKIDKINKQNPVKNINDLLSIGITVEDGLIKRTTELKDNTILVEDFDSETLEKKGEYNLTRAKYAHQQNVYTREVDDIIRGKRTRVKRDNNQVLEETTVIKDPETGETIGIEYLRGSENIPGGFDIQYRDIKNGGITKTLSETRVDEFGNITIKKDYDSLDGTNTKFDYNETLDGSYSSTYKITDAEGNVRLNEHRTFTVLDATHCESTCNGKKYLIEITEDNLLTVTKETGEKVSFDLDEFSDMNMNNANFVELFSHIPGHEFFQMKRAETMTVRRANVRNNAHYMPLDNSVNLGIGHQKLSTFLHEFGHNKDWRILGTEKDSNKVLVLRNDKEVFDVYESERAAFVKAFPSLQRNFVDYFIGLDKVGDRNNRGFAEVIAEANLLLNTNTRGKHSFRGEYLRRYFPKTIALVAKKLNPEIYTN